MAAGFDDVFEVFGDAIREWLNPDNNEHQLESVLLAAIDEYESSQDCAQLQSAPVQENSASHSHTHSRFASSKSVMYADGNWVVNNAQRSPKCLTNNTILKENK